MKSAVSYGFPWGVLTIWGTTVRRKRAQKRIFSAQRPISITPQMRMLPGTKTTTIFVGKMMDKPCKLTWVYYQQTDTLDRKWNYTGWCPWRYKLFINHGMCMYIYIPWTRVKLELWTHQLGVHELGHHLVYALYIPGNFYTQVLGCTSTMVILRSVLGIAHNWIQLEFVHVLVSCSYFCMTLHCSWSPPLGMDQNETPQDKPGRSTSQDASSLWAIMRM